MKEYGAYSTKLSLFQEPLRQYHCDKIVHGHGRHKHSARYEPPPATRWMRLPVGALCRVRCAVLIDQGHGYAQCLDPFLCIRACCPIAHDNVRLICSDECPHGGIQLSSCDNALHEHPPVRCKDGDTAFLAAGINRKNGAAHIPPPFSFSILNLSRRGPIASVSPSAYADMTTASVCAASSCTSP